MNFKAQHTILRVHHNGLMDKNGILIRVRREKAGLTLEELANRVGCSKGTMSQIENGKPLEKTGFITVVRIAKVLGINLNTMFDVSNVRAEIRESSVSMNYIPILNKSQAREYSASVSLYRKGSEMPAIPVQGDLAEALSNNGYAMEIMGYSMFPEFREGDQVIVDPGAILNPGDYVVATFNCEKNVDIRKYKPISYDNDTFVYDLIPLNDDYPIFSEKHRTLDFILGVVVRHIRDPRKK